MTQRELSDEEMTGYRSAYPTPLSRLAQLRWPFQVMGPEEQILGNLVEFDRHYAFLAAAPFPRLLLHCAGGMVNDGNVDWYRENVPGLEIVHLGPGYHYVQEDQPEAIADAITAWLPGLPA